MPPLASLNHHHIEILGSLILGLLTIPLMISPICQFILSMIEHMRFRSQMVPANITHICKSNIELMSRNFILSNVLCVPAAKQNLHYVHQFTKANNVSIEFFSYYFVVKMV